MNDILPDLDGSLKSKNPQVKEGTLKFLARCLASATSPIAPAQIKPLADTLAVLLEDGFEGARNEAAVCFGTLMKMVGERPLNATMENIPDLRKAKIKEAFEKATVKCKAGAAPPRAAGPPAVKKAPTASKAAPKEITVDEVPPPKKESAPPKPPVKAAVRLSILLCAHELIVMRISLRRSRRQHLQLLPHRRNPSAQLAAMLVPKPQASRRPPLLPEASTQ